MAGTAPRLAGALGDRYQVEHELGRGGMATVYLAHDLRHDRKVAVKVIRSELAAGMGADRFLNEIRLTATLQHPHILPLYDSGQAGQLLYYVMPYVAGGSLRARLEREGTLPIDEAVRIVEEAAGALDFAHRQGVVHRDVKPENVLLEEGHAVVADFGVARAVGAARVERITQAGATVGTPDYMSPEACAGEDLLDGRADQYSLGCVFYEMLAGRPPFSGAGARAILARHLTATPEAVVALRPEVPPGIVRVLARALAKDPEDRYESLADFARALRDPGEAEAQGAARTVAVLPFANLSGDPANEYLSDGITDEIISALSRVGGVRVAARSSAFALKGTHLDVRSVGERLRVGSVVEGGVRRDGDRLRITAQLVNAGDGYQVWSARYDRQMKDVFAIQDEIAQSVVGALKVILSEREKATLGRVPTESLPAYEYYLRGRQFLRQTRKRSLAFAREMFARAIELDPNYGLAHAGLADAVCLLANYYPDAGVDVGLAEQASRRALALAPDLPEAHAARGFALWVQKRLDEGQREFERALELDPRLFDALYFYARLRFERGDYREAAALFQRAASLHDDYQAWFFAAQSYAALGRPDQAEAAYRKARIAAEEHLELNPDDPRAATMCAVSRCRLGDREGGLRWAQRALEVDPEDLGVRYNVACLFALEERPEEALQSLEVAVRQGFGTPEWIERDPDLASLHGDPRFEALLASRRRSVAT